MNNIKKMMSHFLLLGLIAGCGFSVAFFNGRTSTPVRTVAEETESSTKEYTAEDFKDEVEVDSNLLGVSISQSNVTETSQSLTFSFRSKTSKGSTWYMVCHVNIANDIEIFKNIGIA